MLDENLFMTFTRRKGTDDCGKEYEIKMSALLALRCVKNSKVNNMWMGLNVSEVGAFDDIVLFIRDDKNSLIAYLIQLKHKINPTKMQPSYINNDFPKKYFESYKSIKKKLQNYIENEKNEIIKYLQNAIEIKYVFYTNRKCSNCDLLVNYMENHKFLNTSPTESGVYLFQSDVLKDDDEFLQNFRLFFGQIDVGGIDEMIKNELKRILNVDVDFNEILKQFVEYIRTWNKGTKTFESLTISDVIGQLTYYVLQNYQSRYDPRSSFYSEFNVWRDITRDQTTIAIERDDFVLNFLQSFVSNDVSFYFKLRSWNEELSQNETLMLHKENPKLRSICTKMFGNDCLTRRNAYIALWLNGNVPLLLESNTSNDITIILNLLELSNHIYKVIIISKKVNDFDFPKCLVTLKYLSNERIIKMKDIIHIICHRHIKNFLLRQNSIQQDDQKSLTRYSEHLDFTNANNLKIYYECNQKTLHLMQPEKTILIRQKENNETLRVDAAVLGLIAEDVLTAESA
ncbi:hypothetical protein FQA39_LY10054 [Lamprigera yunnana]|nr:hypothetical protein FQA39_LY10054 [Lamprigera yunnana]